MCGDKKSFSASIQYPYFKREHDYRIFKVYAINSHFGFFIFMQVKVCFKGEG